MLALLFWCFFGLMHGMYRFATARGEERVNYNQQPLLFFIAYVFVGPFGLFLSREG